MSYVTSSIRKTSIDCSRCVGTIEGPAGPARAEWVARKTSPTQLNRFLSVCLVPMNSRLALCCSDQRPGYGARSYRQSCVHRLQG